MTVDPPDTIYVFWSADGKAIRMWTPDLARTKAFAEESGLEPQPFYTAYCVECNDGITAHDPGLCGNCYDMKYARETP